jgi:CBS domain-containing protein
MGVMFELAKGETEIMEAFEEQANTVVMDVMTKNVVTCRPDDDLNKVASLLVKKSINRLPVVDEEDHVVGIITRGDIVQAFAHNSG